MEVFLRFISNPGNALKTSLRAHFLPSFIFRSTPYDILMVFYYSYLILALGLEIYRRKRHLISHMQLVMQICPVGSRGFSITADWKILFYLNICRLKKYLFVFVATVRSCFVTIIDWFHYSVSSLLQHITPYVAVIFLDYCRVTKKIVLCPCRYSSFIYLLVSYHEGISNISFRDSFYKPNWWYLDKNSDLFYLSCLHWICPYLSN